MIVDDKIIDQIRDMALKYNAGKVILFGSALNNDKMINDIDLAADIKGLDLLSFAGNLENIFNFPVDIIPLEPSNPFINHIKSIGKIIYEPVN